MSLAQASEYRKGHRDKPLMPIPGKLVPYPPEEPAKADKTSEPPAGKEPEDEELPKDLNNQDKGLDLLLQSVYRSSPYGVVRMECLKLLYLSLIHI